MERLRYALGRLNTTAVGLLLIGLALALFVVPRFVAAPAPAPQPMGAVAGPGAAPLPNSPAQPPAPPAPQAVNPAVRQDAPPAPQPAGPDRPVGPDRPAAQPDRLPPPPPHAGWMNNIGGWFVNLFAFTGAMTALASFALIGLLLWRSLTLARHDRVDQV